MVVVTVSVVEKSGLKNWF